MSNSQHVTKHRNGGWQVKKANASKATRRTSTQAEAITIARNIASNNNQELVIHGKNGRIRQKDSHGRDPFPPKG